MVPTGFLASTIEFCWAAELFNIRCDRIGKTRTCIEGVGIALRHLSDRDGHIAMRKIFVATCLVATVVVYVALAQDPTGSGAAPQLGKSSVKEVIAAMTTEEKAKLLVGMGMDLNIPGISLMDEEDKNTLEKVPGAAGRTHAITRLGIPSLTLSDGPAGVRINPIRKGDSARTYHATGFPIGTLLASSWDTSLVQRVGVALGSEAREYGIDILLAPALNIHRNPLGGRNFEYYSEDPLLSGRVAAAYVKGVQSNGIGTSIKHLAANNQEFNRMQSNSLVSERALREIYLKGFEIAVRESQPWTVMSSYNLINGTYTSQSPELLTAMLRKEWGFKGLVMTDWFGGNNAVTQLKSGNDVLMPGLPEQTKAIVSAASDGTLTKEQLDENVERVLNLVLQAPAFKGYKYSEQPDLKVHAQIAREAATQGMVLLKNDGNTLPLAASSKISLFGDSSYDLIAGGTGSGDVHKAYVTSLDQGLTAAGYVVDASLRTSYQHYIADQKSKRPKLTPLQLLFPQPPIPEMPLELNAFQKAANDSDVAIITLGRKSGEFSDRKVEDDFLLTATEHSILKNVSEAFHAKAKKVIVVLNVGGVIEVASWRDQVDAVLLAWQPGQEGGHSITDVLSGKVSPSGRLATTFPVTYEDVPSSKTFPGKELVGHKPLTINPFAGKPAEVTYEEGIYVGYRYYNTFGIKPAYEFGYGLSYTDFSYGEVKLSSSRFDVKVTASVSITNTGKVSGKDVVQLYIAAPKRELSKPERELRAFAKTDLLRPGQSQTLTFTITPDDLASYDSASSSWIAEAGPYTVAIGASSMNIQKTAKLALEKDLLVAKVSKLLSPQREIVELKPNRNN
jgi:beta-glucosidase